MNSNVVPLNKGSAIDLASRLLEMVTKGQLRDFFFCAVDTKDEHLYFMGATNNMKYIDLLMAQRQAHALIDMMEEKP